MTRTTIFLLSLFLFGFWCIFRIDNVYAATYFFDDFSTDSLSTDWEFVHVQGETGGSWKIDDGHLVGEIGYYSSSHLYLIDSNVPDDNYIIDLDVVNVSGVDQSILFRISQDRSLYYQVDFRYADPFWPQDNNNMKLYKYDHGNYFLLQQLTPLDLEDQVVLSQGVPHTVKIVCDGGLIKVYFDSVLVFDYDGGATYNWVGRGIAFRNWAGSYFARPVVNYFDNVRISGLLEERSWGKVVVVPGLGASWNGEAMVYNHQTGAGEWRMTPLVKTYDGLVSALEENGLVEDSDFYVWNYDWRRPVEEIVDNFDGFVDEVREPEEKVAVVGHSLGGLVARIWSQENQSKADKVISLGSPHRGAVAAYEAWSGGKLGEGVDIGTIALNILLQLQKEGGQTRVETIRAYAPVLNDLLPTFDFVKKGRRVVPVGSLEAVNQYLPGVNLQMNNWGQFLAMVGVGERTKEWLMVRNRSFFDKVLGIWPDGQPVGYVWGEGDGTVLKKSAKFEGDDFVEVTANHGTMVNQLTSKVLEELGLGPGQVGSEEDLGPKVIFYLGSPAKMIVDCQGKLFAAVDGFVEVGADDYPICVVQLEGVGEGKYHLVMGRTDKGESWKYFEGKVNEGERLSFGVMMGNLNLTPDEATEDYVYGLIREDLEWLRNIYGEVKSLADAEEVVAGRDLQALMNSVFEFRREKKEMEASGRILDNIDLLLVMDNFGCSLAEARADFYEARRARSMVDRVTRLRARRGQRPSVFGALSYQLMVDKLEAASEAWRQGQGAQVRAKSILVVRLSREVW